MSDENRFPFFVVSGRPRERGRSYGEQAADRIAVAAELYRGALAKLPGGAAEVSALAERFLREVEDFDTDQSEEMRGISEGSGVPLQDILLINARRELISMVAWGTAVENDDECTAAAVLPEASADGELFHGQNWDTSPEHATHSLVLRVEQTDGPDILVFTEAGAVARSGMNSAGISITGNNMASDRDYKNSGVPLPLIRRKALAGSVYALAISTVYATHKSGSNNMMLSHRAGEAIDIECAPDESFLLHPQDGLLTHANHWESVPALCKLRDIGATNDSAIASTPCSTFRSQRIRRLLRDQVRAGGVTWESFHRVFLDDFDSPFAICRPPRAAAGGDGQSATAATVLMRPSAGYMDVAALPALGATWVRYHVSGGAPEVLTDSFAS